MEFIHGMDLRDLISTRGEDDPINAARILSQILDGLIAFGRAAEQVGGTTRYAHRDIKPENIMIEFIDGRAIRAVLLDFGLAKLPGSELTGFKIFRGTKAYSAPWIMAQSRDADQCSDNYGLAAVYYWQVTGTNPFNFNPENPKDYANIGNFIRNPKPTIARLRENLSSYVPGELIEVIFGALVPSRAESRFKTYVECKAALDAGIRTLAPQPRR